MLKEKESAGTAVRWEDIVTPWAARFRTIDDDEAVGDLGGPPAALYVPSPNLRSVEKGEMGGRWSGRRRK